MAHGKVRAGSKGHSDENTEDSCDTRPHRHDSCRSNWRRRVDAGLGAGRGLHVLRWSLVCTQSDIRSQRLLFQNRTRARRVRSRVFSTFWAAERLGAKPRQSASNVGGPEGLLIALFGRFNFVTLLWHRIPSPIAISSCDSCGFYIHKHSVGFDCRGFEIYMAKVVLI
jgi:hypothetical protein